MHPDDAILGECTPAQLSVLLALALPQAREPRSLTAAVADTTGLRRLLATILDPTGGTAEDLLGAATDPTSTLERLVAVKLAAKRLIRNASTDDHVRALTIVYHAATAAAFAVHAAQISSCDLEQRLGLYEDLASALAGHPLGDVFRRCVDRAGSAS